VLIWSHFDQTGALVEQLAAQTRGWATVVRAPFESQGADVREL
jgi:homoserine kinase